jgi:hypothetical protein
MVDIFQLLVLGLKIKISESGSAYFIRQKCITLDFIRLDVMSSGFTNEHGVLITLFLSTNVKGIAHR